MSYEYIIRNNRRIRPFTKSIIITHVSNLIENHFISPDAVTHNNFFTAGVMEQYFMRSLKKPMLPYHYYVDNIGEDWYIFKGLREMQPSYFIEDLISAGVIKYEYINSILIVISDDFSRYTVDSRMSEQMTSKLITELFRRHKLHYDKLFYIDECLTDNWEENLKTSNLLYKYKPGPYFDKTMIKMDINKFNIS